MIETWVVSYSLILARVGTFVVALPYLGGRNVPRLVKLGLTLSLSTMWFGSHEVASEIDYEAGATVPWLAFGLAIGRESLLGALLGFLFSLFLLPARIAGEFIGQEMGLSLSSLADPSGENSATLLGQIFEVLGLLIFFGLDGHHIWLATLHVMFLQWPIGGSIGSLPVVPLIGGLSAAHEWGLMLAAPVAILMFVTSVVLTLLARTAPQLNLFSVGFALRLVIGLLGVLLFMPEFAASFTVVTGRFGGFLHRMI